MALTAARREEILRGLKGTARFHGAYQYPKQCYGFADLAEKQVVEMPPVNNHPYRIYIFTAKNQQQGCPVHINIHGGGWINPHQINDELFSAWLADAVKGIVVDVDYTLSDEGPWPAAFEQCCAVGRYVYEQCSSWGGDPNRISIGGYSAGGNLAMCVALKAVQTGDFPLCLVVNGYGPVDLATTPQEKAQAAGVKWMMPPERDRLFTELYLDGDFSLAVNPYVSPAFASDGLLARMPQTLICTAGNCSFRFEDEALGARMAALGVEVTMRRFPGAEHGFIPHFMEGWEDGADLIARRIREAGLS